MTDPGEVPVETVIVEGVGGGWVVLPHGQPVERFQKRADAIAKADELSRQYVRHWTIIVRPAPGPFYE